LREHLADARRCPGSAGPAAGEQPVESRALAPSG